MPSQRSITLFEFQARFPDDDACERFLIDLRWPSGFRCPRCQHSGGLRLAGRWVWQCRTPGCQRQTSATAGTILHRTQIPLRVWFWAAYLVTVQKPGISALQLQRQLGLRRVETAWILLHRLRRAMVSSQRTKLSGTVEIDETWIGAKQEGLRGSRQLKGRKAALVLVAVEQRGKGTGRARMALIPDFKATTIAAFVTANIEPGSTIVSDGLTSFRVVSRLGYTHRRGVQGRVTRGSVKVTPLADRAMGNLKQWLLGTHHGVRRSHLQSYLDEFVFRHNRRGNSAAAFATLLTNGIAAAPHSWRTIVGG